MKITFKPFSAIVPVSHYNVMFSMFRKESNVNVLMFFNSPAAQRCLPSNLEWSEEWPEGEAPSGPVYPKVLQQLSRTGRLGHQCSA